MLATAGLVVTGLIAAAPASASAGPTAHRITVHPEISPAGAKAPNATFGCQTRPMDDSQGPRCYQPAQIQNAYNITPLLNRGINGEDAPEMLARFSRDVIEQKPDLILWQVGTNAVLHNPGIAGQASLIRQGIERLKATGADVVLIDPQYAPAVLAHLAV